MSGRSRRATLGFLIVCALAAAGFTALGVWQLQRRAWKTDLIARVEQRIHAAPVALPGPGDWPKISAARDEYRVVAASGHYIQDRQTFVRAVTELGGGYWVMTPFRTDQGFVVLVNRGFVPPEWRTDAGKRIRPPDGSVRIAGLLRMTEPGGAFLHRNAPAEDRWYSRDVGAIAAARRLGDVAPYFIDRFDATDRGWPRGGLTVVRFPNSHLVYALTWFGLALLVAVLFIRSRSALWHESLQGRVAPSERVKPAHRS